MSNLGKWSHQDTIQADWLWMLLLLLAALALFGINLGGLPLRDWDEGTVAQVAREIFRAPPDALTWLYPTLGGEPYLNKPPLIHGLIAIAYAIGGVNEWTARLPGAILTALSVPLLYAIGKEVFYRRPPALFAALVYLTTLPVVRHGRLAMLDGAILFFLMAMIWCLLRSRRNTRYALGIGLGLGLICLTKGVMMGMLLGAIACIFLLWDTPRLFTVPELWIGIGLGLFPVGVWYGAQWMHYGSSFLGSNLLHQSFSRIWTAVEDHGYPPWYYLLELLKYGFPWILFLPLGLKDAWEYQNLSWTKLVLTWSSIYLIAISLMSTKLPWYVLPLYPALALISGMQLSIFWEQGRHWGIKQFSNQPYSPVWIGLFAILALVSAGGSLYFGQFSSPIEYDLMLPLAAIAITLGVVAVLVWQNDSQFVAILIWGTYITLLLFLVSDHWIWELAEAYPVKPVAQMIQAGTPAGTTIYTSFPYHRPSLDFYSDRQIQPANIQQLKRQWRRASHPYLLVDDPTLESLRPKPETVIGTQQGFTLITRH